MSIGRHGHNYEGFFENFAYVVFVNEGGQSQLKVPIQALRKLSLLFSFSLDEER